MNIDEPMAARVRAAADRVRSRQLALDEARADFLNALRNLFQAGASAGRLAELLDLTEERVQELLEQPPPVPSQRPTSGPLACSFCGRTRARARKLIAGPAVVICDDCVGLARRVLAHEVGGHPVLFAVDDGSCSFCGKRREHQPALPPADRPAPSTPDGLVAGDGGTRICTGCLDLCDEIMEEELNGSTDVGQPT